MIQHHFGASMQPGSRRRLCDQALECLIVRSRWTSLDSGGEQMRRQADVGQSISAHRDEDLDGLIH
jgi:hypothetical protein